MFVQDYFEINEDTILFFSSKSKVITVTYNILWIKGLRLHHMANETPTCLLKDLGERNFNSSMFNVKSQIFSLYKQKMKFCD